jgi:peptidoglycan/xylan/chitin deacetylase (PgdA/CDA1 family)
VWRARKAARVSVLVLVLICMWWGVPATMPGPMSARAGQVDSVRVPILLYHAIDYSGLAYSVTPEQLHAQCAWLLQNGYTSITLGQFWDASLGYATLPPNPVVLTNDDGWSSAVTFADILAEYGFIGNYFINNVSPLSTDAIWGLAQRGEIEAHTATHAWMSSLAYEGQLAEIVENKSYLEGVTGQPVRFLAWPFGDRNESAIQAAAAAGIVAAFGLGGTAAYTGAVDPYQIPRIMMEAKDDLDTFVAKVSGW